MTYLFIQLLPMTIYVLCHLAYPTKNLATTIHKTAPWHLKGKPHVIQHKRVKRYKKPIRELQDKAKNQMLQTYLFPAAFAALKVGCCVESFLQCFSGPPIWDPTCLALQSESMLQVAPPPVRFDSDSYPVGVDNHASKCMANAPNLFEDLRLDNNKGQVDGINSGLDIPGQGTFRFNITNDDGKIHAIKIPNSLYVPNLKRCLMLPQHWVQEAGDEQTWIGNYRDSCVLNWRGGKKTVPFQPTTNVPVFYVASSSRSYRTFAATFEATEAPYFQWEKVLEFPGCRDLMDDIVPEEFVVEENLNYNKEVSVNEGVSEDDKTIKTSNLPTPPADENPSKVIRRGPLTFNPLPSQEEIEDTQLATANDQTELMRWHYRFGHLPFVKLKQLALNREIPKKLAKVKPPKCAGCLFGAMTRIPWHGRESKASHEVFIATKPGECVSIDQMMSTEVGFYAQMKGKLTKKQYRCATIFVDHYSRLCFVHLQIDYSSVKTVAAKRTFKSFADEIGVKIQHYHCDNGQFSDNAFKQACHEQRQQLTFCGVNAHFQNGIAEQAIYDLSESAHKQLLHTCARWLQAVHFALWPYALHNAALLHNSLPVLEDSTSRLELFSSIRVGCNMKHVHTFGCPVFALKNALASGNQLPRWSPCACLGLNLGPNPMHARNVYLVLNLITGCVSPQYHCLFDDFFEMTRHGGPDVSGTIC